MSDFDDFGLGGNVGGVMPTYKQSIPTDVRTSRPFIDTGGNLPKFYYDFEAKKRFHALRRLKSRTSSQ
jgi:hypothetical protein